MLEPYNHIKTLQDLKTALETSTRATPLVYRSPTDCFFPRIAAADEASGDESDSEDNDSQLIYVDSQGCISWYLNGNGTVSVGPDTPDIVAASLPEFLARINLENKLWYATSNYFSTEFTPDIKKYLSLLEVSLPKDVFSAWRSRNSNYGNYS